MYTGNRAALANVRFIRNTISESTLHDNDKLDIEAQLQMIEEEVKQMRKYINENVALHHDYPLPV